MVRIAIAVKCFPTFWRKPEQILPFTKVKTSDRFFSPPKKRQNSLWLLQSNYPNANSK